MRYHWRYFMAVLFFFASTCIHGEVATAQDDSTKKILILNSYHPGYAWSDAEQAAIVDTFRAQDSNWLPFIEYLDCKRRPRGEHIEELTRLLRIKYHDQNLSLVITLDNPALEFIMKNQTKLFGNSPIVFCGINDFRPAMLDGHSNVTGRAENIDIRGTIEVMLRLHPAAREILVLHDYTVTGLAVRKEVEDLIPRFSARVKFRFNDQLDMKDLLKEIERLPKDSLVLEIGFITDKSGRTFGLTETTDLFVKHSPVPVYGAYEARLGHGIIGGKLISAGIHGANTAMMALRVLAGEKASNIPVETESDAQFMFDHRAMSRIGIPLSALPENSIIINQLVSFYAAHRTFIHFALAVIGVLCAIICLLTINIVQRRRSTMALSQSEYRQRVLLDNIPDPAWLKDRDGRYLAVNEAWRRLFNLNTSHVIGKTASDVFPAEVAKRFMEEDEEIIRHGSQLRKEESLMDKNGGISWFDKANAPIVNGQGIVVGSIGITRNITERKRAEQALKTSHRFLEITNRHVEMVPLLKEFVAEAKNFTGCAAVGIRVLDEESYIPYEAYEGFSQTFYESESPLSIKSDQCMCVNVIKGVVDPKLPFYTEGGSFYMNGTTRFLATVSEEEKGQTRNVCNEFGYESVALVPISLGDSILGLIHMADPRENMVPLEMVQLLEKTAMQLGTAIQRVRAETEVRTSEEKYQSLVESTEDSIYLLDRNCKYLFMNKRHLSRLGMEAEKPVGRTYSEFHSEDDTKDFVGKVEKVFETGKSLYYEHRSLRDSRYFLRTLSPVKDPDGRVAGITIISKDITERKKAEEDLRRSNEELLKEHNQRMMLSKSLIELLEKDRKQIAMELHDEIGQTLTFLKMSLEMIHGKLKPGHSELETQITTAQERTIQAIKDVKNVSHGLWPATIDALGVVSSLRELFNEIQQQTDMEIQFFSQGIPKRFEGEKELAIYRIAQEALVNIIRHARAKHVFVNLVKKDEMISLSVEDDGVGFDLDRTMKPSKKRGPLGLLIMRERAVQLDGEFTIESQHGKGTHLLVEIPL
ncbi:MAG: ABC transporter substrate binding protein [Pseudomonadota bacterium]